jgi:hypothetical protein
MNYVENNIDTLGKLISVRRLNYACDICGKVATKQIERSNKGLPDEYIQDGTRAFNRCEEHVPEDAAKMWANELGR